MPVGRAGVWLRLSCRAPVRGRGHRRAGRGRGIGEPARRVARVRHRCRPPGWPPAGPGCRRGRRRLGRGAGDGDRAGRRTARAARLRARCRRPRRRRPTRARGRPTAGRLREPCGRGRAAAGARPAGLAGHRSGSAAERPRAGSLRPGRRVSASPSLVVRRVVVVDVVIADVERRRRPARGPGRPARAGPCADLCGARTMIMFRPSCFGALSTKPSSETSAANRCSSRKPSSGRDCSRPRNMMVTLTLSPALRNRTTWPFLVS